MSNGLLLLIAALVLADLVAMSALVRHLRRKRRKDDPSQEGW